MNRKPIIVDFTVVSDVMFDGTINSLSNGSVLRGTKLRYELWEDYLTDEKYPFWVVKALGIKTHEVVKISEYNRKGGHIVCERLNPKFKGFNVKIEDIQALYYITHETRKISKN